MADIEAGLFTLLSTNAGISALVATRIYPLRIPEGATLPAVAYHKVTGPRTHSKDGDMSLSHPRFQVTCWAKDYSDAKAVRDAVIAALDGFTDGGTMGGVVVDQVIVENDLDLLDNQTLEFGASIDAIIWHQ
jgi:uncharacterized protein DUF3168